jgi:cyclic pyranopterin phosphate synthase
MTPFDASAPSAPRSAPLADSFGRAVTYLRLSVTDRCDLRCVYCMPQSMRFLPRAETLTLEELDRLASVFIDLGVKTLRLTGGEPLVRRDVILLVERLSRHLDSGALRELTLTTNGSRLAEHAAALARAGVRRINVSLDTLDREAYRRITRGGRVETVLEGLAAAEAAGLSIKLNALALPQTRAHIPELLAFAHGRGFDLTLIETMPLGEVDQERVDQFLPMSEIRNDLAAVYTLDPSSHATGGPARYVTVRETGGRLGFITPLSQTFCSSCNRVRVTCTGALHACLGREEGADLRAALREHPGDDRPVREAIARAIGRKAEGHAFSIAKGQAPSVGRHMSTTGG